MECTYRLACNSQEIELSQRSLAVVYAASVIFSIESLVVGVTVFLAGWLAIVSTTFLHQSWMQKAQRIHPAVLVLNFALAAVLFFFLLKWIADLAF